MTARTISYWRKRADFHRLVAEAHAQIEHARELRLNGHQSDADWLLNIAAGSRKRAAGVMASARAAS